MPRSFVKNLFLYIKKSILSPSASLLYYSKRKTVANVTTILYPYASKLRKRRKGTKVCLLLKNLVLRKCFVCMLHNAQTAQCIRLSKTLTAFHTANRLSHSFPHYMGGLFYHSFTDVPSLLDIAMYKVQELTMLLWGDEKKTIMRKKRKRQRQELKKHTKSTLQFGK